MRLLHYYITKEVDGECTERRRIFSPKGLCNFYAVMTYKCGPINTTYTFDTTHKVDVKKFAKWTQPFLIEAKNQFTNHITNIQFQALQTNDISLLENLRNMPIEGSFQSYVVAERKK